MDAVTIAERQQALDTALLLAQFPSFQATRSEALVIARLLLAAWPPGPDRDRAAAYAVEVTA